jgi:hypothetical protein
MFNRLYSIDMANEIARLDHVNRMQVLHKCADSDDNSELTEEGVVPPGTRPSGSTVSLRRREGQIVPKL